MMTKKELANHYFNCGFTQSEIAKMLGVSRQRVSQYFGHNVTNFRTEKYRAFARHQYHKLTKRAVRLYTRKECPFCDREKAETILFA